MKSWYKLQRLVSAALVMTLLSGCAQETGETPFVTPIEPEVITLNISVERNPTEESREGLRLFAKKLSELTHQAISISIVYVEDPYESLQKGEADAIYCSSAKLALYSPEFSIYASPFYFRSYEQMTMTLNSPTFHELTGEDFRTQLGLIQLGAIFKSSTVLLCEGRNLTQVRSFNDLTIGVDGDRLTNLVFSKMGAKVTRLVGEDKVDQFAEGLIPAIECSTQDLDTLAVGGLSRPYLTETFHRTNVEWFLISTEKYDALSPEQQAGIQEASAYLVSTVDAARLETYRAGLEKLERGGVKLISPGSDTVQRRAQEILYADKNFYALTDWTRYDAVSAIIR